MDRRGFLRLAGIGGAVASVALVLPAVQKLAVPDPQRRYFLPPAGGWPVGNQSINTAQVLWIGQEPGRDAVLRMRIGPGQSVWFERQKPDGWQRATDILAGRITYSIDAWSPDLSLGGRVHSSASFTYGTPLGFYG